MDIEILQMHNVIGVIGTLAYLVSYFLLQMGTIRAESYTYCLVNMAAASLVMISLMRDFNLASSLIQISWIVISVLGIFRLAKLSRQRRRKSRYLKSIYITSWHSTPKATS